MTATTRWRVDVDTATCIGTGVCAVLAPHALVRAGRTTSPRGAVVEPDETVVDAAESCPVEAVLVREIDTGRVVAPSE